jgi:hypothetical protein
METEMANILTHKVVFVYNGECSTTAPSPLAPYTSEWDERVANETGNYILSNDDWRLITMHKYTVRDVQLPEWLPLNKWLNNTTSWKWVFGMVKNGINTDLAPEFLFWLASSDLRTPDKLAIVRLMETKKFRSGFRESMRNQVQQWLSTPVDDRKYRTPLSPKQMEYIFTPGLAIEAKHLDHNLYWSR